MKRVASDSNDQKNVGASVGARATLTTIDQVDTMHGETACISIETLQ